MMDSFEMYKIGATSRSQRVGKEGEKKFPAIGETFFSFGIFQPIKEEKMQNKNGNEPIRYKRAMNFGPTTN